MVDRAADSRTQADEPWFNASRSRPRALACASEGPGASHQCGEREALWPNRLGRAGGFTGLLFRDRALAGLVQVE